MNRHHANRAGHSAIRIAACIALGTSTGLALAWDIPSGLGEDDDALVWNSDAPSFNIYEDGVYVATVHGNTRYEPIYSNSVYAIAAHDHGLEFSPLSTPFHYVDDENEDDEDEDDELEFDELEVYFELNNTDGDLGIHSIVDGEPWQRLQYEDTNGRTLIDVRLSGSMAEQGLTEFFFESSEPGFDELDPLDFLARFPDGIYDVEGQTVEGEDIEGEAILSSVLPAAPVVYIGERDNTANEGCEEDTTLDPPASLNTDGSLPVRWDPVTTHHQDLGSAGEIRIEVYQLVLEGTDSELSIQLDADITAFLLPASLVESGDNVKIEVIARDATHNQVATEACANVI